MSHAVEEYLAALPPAQRIALERLREIIRKAVPVAEETIRTRVPAWRYRDKPLVSIGAARRHVALYIMYGSVLKTHRAALGAFEISNTVVRFAPEKPLPAALVTKLVTARRDEIDDALSSRPPLRQTASA